MSKKPQPFYSEQNSRRNEINIYRIDDTLLKTHHARPREPHRNDYQAIIWINAGSGTHLIDDQLYDVEPNTFMLVTNDQMHAFNPKSGTIGCSIRFCVMGFYERIIETINIDFIAPAIFLWIERLSLFTHFFTKIPFPKKRFSRFSDVNYAKRGQSF